MSIVKILDKEFKPYISREELKFAIERMASQIDNDCNASSPFFICVLNGSFIFAADLLKNIKTSCQIEFVRLKSYDGTVSKETIQEVLGLQSDIAGKDIIIIEDIVDTGYTLASFLEKIKRLNPRSVKIASLLFKKEAFKKDFKIDYLGIEIENKFIVGYGLDYNEFGRNLPEIFQIV